MRSPALTVGLLCLIGLVSIVGTIPAAALDSEGSFGWFAGLFHALGGEGIFATRWYTSLLFFLAFLMVYCSVRRLPSTIKLFNLTPAPASWANKKELLVHSLSYASSSESEVRGKIARILRDCGFHAHKASDESNDRATLFDKGRAGVWGPPLVHLGLVITLVGGLITHNFGTVRETTLAEGEAQRIPEANAKVRLEKFSILQYPGTREPEEYVSSLVVAGEDNRPSWHTLRVNQPLRLGDATLFQIRYRPEIRYINLAAFEPEDRTPLAAVQLAVGQREEIPGLNIEVELEQVVPDFAVDSNNNILSRSQYFLNPAAEISVYSPPGTATPVWTGWAFKGMFPSHKPSTVPALFVIDRVSLKYYSGIKVVKDPGAWVAYLGFLLLVVGSLISCFMFRRFIRIEFESEGENSGATISGYSLKNHPDFSYEWKTLIARLRKIAGE